MFKEVVEVVDIIIVVIMVAEISTKVMGVMVITK